MTRRRRRREIQTLSLSFLDSISCGFGAIILLLVITKLFEPIHLQQSKDQLQGTQERYRQELTDVMSQTLQVGGELQSTTKKVDNERTEIAKLQKELTRIRATYSEKHDDAQIASQLAGRLAQAKESLTEQMKRLLANNPQIDESKVAGVSVDSEYIVFIIDTSGSMRQYVWGRVEKQIRDTLAVYPKVKGFQVMNDEGIYMFQSYARKWIPDTPGRRKAVLDALKNWNAFSNSSPVEGIIAAIRAFEDPNKKIALYYYGDDFAGGESIDTVVREIDRINRADAHGNRHVRINGVAFPTYWDFTGGQLGTAARFSVLMRALCQRNGGTFVALPSRGAI